MMCLLRFERKTQGNMPRESTDAVTSKITHHCHDTSQVTWIFDHHYWNTNTHDVRPLRFSVTRCYLRHWVAPHEFPGQRILFLGLGQNSGNAVNSGDEPPALFGQRYTTMDTKNLKWRREKRRSRPYEFWKNIELKNV